MTYIVERKSRFYVVAYDGIDPLTGPERRARSVMTATTPKMSLPDSTANASLDRRRGAGASQLASS